MNTKICTDLEQSKKLVELGIDTSTADMVYYCNKSNNTLISQRPFIRSFKETDTFSYLYCWSLAALIDLMPNVNGHYPELCRGKHTGQYYMWIEDTFDTQTFNNPIDAAFEMICWLKENEKI